MKPYHLTAAQIALLIGYALAMSAGQLLFKVAAQQMVGAEHSLFFRLIALTTNGYFVVAMMLYTVLTVLWVWILTFTPLSYAYPFIALAFAITPFFAGLLFGDPISIRMMLGCLLIVCGIIVIAH